MTAGAGILHDELPTERSLPRRRAGARGPALGQPARRVEDDAAALPGDHRRRAALLTSDDGGALVRFIAGDSRASPDPDRRTRRSPTCTRRSRPGAEIAVPWNPAFSAMAYVLTGRGTSAPTDVRSRRHQLVVFGPGDNLVMRAAATSRRMRRARRAAARRPADPRADRAVRTVRDEHPRGDRRSDRGLPGRAVGHQAIRWPLPSTGSVRYSSCMRPAWKSSIASMICSRVFIRNGP